VDLKGKDQMNCYYHPDRAFFGRCDSCGKSICTECAVVLKEKFYCTPCVEKLGPESLKNKDDTGRSWFQRHLNWTAIPGFIILYLIDSFIVFFIFVYISLSGPGETSLISYDENGLIFILLSILIIIFPQALISLPLTCWILREKDQSLLWALISLIPFGWIVYMFLENKSGILDTVDGNILNRKKRKLAGKV
jgi:hypothetical protein